jgi:hypothetical protein
MRPTVDTEQLLQGGGTPEDMDHNRTWRCAVFVGKGMAAKISTKKCCPRAVNIACHIKKSINGFRSSRKGERVSKTNVKSVGR